MFDVIGPRIDRRKDSRSCDHGRRGNERDPSREIGEGNEFWAASAKGPKRVEGWEWNVESKMLGDLRRGARQRV